MTRGIRTEPVPYCPVCGAQMRLKKPGPLVRWEPFWGCTEYPDCRGSRNIKEDGTPENDGD